MNPEMVYFGTVDTLDDDPSYFGRDHNKRLEVLAGATTGDTKRAQYKLQIVP